jgi:hypothetical protein
MQYVYAPSTRPTRQNPHSMASTALLVTHLRALQNWFLMVLPASLATDLTAPWDSLSVEIYVALSSSHGALRYHI